MSKLFPLLKVQFLSLFGINKIANKKKGKSAGLLLITAVAMLFCGLIFGIAYIYGYGFAEMYLMMGQTKLFLPSMFALANVVCLVFSFYSVSGNIYLSKDHDLLSAMPIKTRIIVLSKLIFSYLADLIFVILILIPSVIIHFDIIGALSISTLLNLFLMSLFAPVFSMIVSMVLGTLFSFISSKFKRKELVQSILYSVFFIAVYAVSMVGADLTDQLGAIRKFYFLYDLAVKGIYEINYALIFCGASFVAVALSVFIVCITYNKLNTLLKSVKRAKGFKLKTYKQNSQFKVLVQKEFKLLFSSAIYFMNTLTGSVVAVLGTVAILILSASMPMLSVIFSLIMQSIYAFSFMIAPTTAVSISVEGSSFYIMRSSPIPTKRLFNAKLFVNFLIGVIPATICAIAIAISMIGEAEALQIIFTFLTIPLYSLLGGNLGLLFNLLFPMMKWDNIQKPVKSSTSVALTLLSGMFIAGGVFALLYFVNIKTWVKLLIIFSVLLSLTILTYNIIMEKGEKWLIQKT